MAAPFSLKAVAAILLALALAGGAPAALVDVSGEITNPNATIGAGNTANLVGNTTFGWQTGTTAIPAILNGYTFTLDSGNGNAFNYAGDISGPGDVVFRMAPEGSHLANNAMVLSGATSNAYTGTSLIAKGHVSMQKPGAIALPGNVIVGGQGSNDRLSWGANNQVADSADIALLSNFTATLDLNGYSDTVNVLSLAGNGVLNLGGGSLTASAVNYSGAWLGAGTYQQGDFAFIQGLGTLEVLGASAGNDDPGRVGLNFAGATNNPGGRKALAPSTAAGAPGFEQANWNNTPGTGQTGTPSSANDTLTNLIDHNGYPTTVSVTFTSPQTWGHDFGAGPTGDQMLMGNGITDGTPTVTVSDVPYSLYDLVVYIGMYSPGRDSVYQLDDGSTVLERYARAPIWGDFDTTGWVEVSDAALSPATRETGNYMVFEGLTASSFTLTSLNGGGINGIQILQVPEPGAFALALLAAIGMLLVRGRRMRSR